MVRSVLKSLKEEDRGREKKLFRFFFLRALKSAITCKAAYAYKLNNKKIVNEGGLTVSALPAYLSRWGTHFQMG